MHERMGPFWFDEETEELETDYAESHTEEVETDYC